MTISAPSTPAATLKHKAGHHALTCIKRHFGRSVADVARPRRLGDRIEILACTVQRYNLAGGWSYTGGRSLLALPAPAVR